MPNIKPTKKVVAAGHICLDITPIFPETCRGDIHDIIVPGRLINVDQAQIHIGGSVANTGLAMSFLGADVQLIGKVGRDDFGENITRIVKSHHIAERMIVSETSHTSYSIILAVPGNDRIFLHDPGANDTFEFSDLDLDAIRQASLFHFGYPPLMKRLYSNNGVELTKIFRAVAEAGVVTSLDMAAIDPSSPAAREDWTVILANTLPFVDIFMPSLEELLFMLDKPKYFALNKAADGKDLTRVVDIEKDVQPLAEKAIQMGAGIVLIKCGEPGLYFKTAGAERLAQIESRLGCSLADWPDRSGFEDSFIPDRVASATGAGDVTIAAFLTALLSGYSLETCLKYATAEGASCVEAYDSLSGLRTFDDIRAKILGGWKKRGQ
jgi:sugar/nucleoside kinase (ribokinase family)